MNKYNLDITQVLEVVKDLQEDLAFNLLFDLDYKFVWAGYDKINKIIVNQCYLNRKGEQGYIVYCSSDEDKTYAFEYKDSIEKY